MLKPYPRHYRSASPIIPLRNTPERYGAVAQALHWTIVLLVAVQFYLGVTAHDLPVSLLRLKLLVWHKSFGITIFLLVLLRLAWRSYSPAPALPATLKGLQRRIAHVSHVLLYALLLVMPLVGWISSSASNLTVKWFFLVELPNLVQPDPDLAKLSKEVHILMAWCLLALVTLHATAAFWHELVLKDGVLRRMLPLPIRKENR
jgi:cytochrome b561